MLGLPAHPGRTGELLLAVGIVAALTLAPLVWRHTLAATSGAVVVAGLVALVIVSTTAAAPFVAWRIVEDVRYTSRLTRPQAERIGGDDAGIDWRAYTWLRMRLPPRATYALRLRPLDRVTRVSTLYWSGYVLLPRVRLADPREAQWVVGWGTRPEVPGVRLGPASRLELPGATPSTYYVARVLR